MLTSGDLLLILGTRLASKLMVCSRKGYQTCSGLKINIMGLGLVVEWGGSYFLSWFDAFKFWLQMCLKWLKHFCFIQLDLCLQEHI